MTHSQNNVNKGSKSILAQLLATENISVRHDIKSKTAMFDTKNRVLVLPVWKDMDNSTYDMLVGHEIGHALYTPYDDARETASKHKGEWSVDAQEIGGDSHGHIAMSYLNIVEDARIERLIKTKFPGLRRDFIAAYNFMNAKDFFDLKKSPAEKRCFMDRINLHFKLGVSAEQNMGVTFSTEEQVFVDRIAESKTFEDVVQITKDIWDFEISQNREKAPPPEPQMAYKKVKGGGEEGEEGDAPQECNGIQGGKGYDLNSVAPAMPACHEAFLKNSEKLVDKSTKDCSYLTIPAPILENLIITAAEINQIRSSHTEMLIKQPGGYYRDADKYFEESLVKAKTFITQSKKSVGILVKQFEMKKAADAHKRTNISKTGILDCVKMMKYKFSEDIFARHVTIREGKNHGVVMFVDWSSSMTDCIEDTIKQCFLIALFCKKCNIPFEVYSFSSVHVRLEMMGENLGDVESVKCGSWKSKDGTPYTNDSQCMSGAPKMDSSIMQLDNFALLNFVSSSMSMKEMTSALANMFNISQRNAVSPLLVLHSTPLNECIVAASSIVNAFQKKHNIQICSSIFLTDGEGGTAYNSNANSKVFLIDPASKKTYNTKKYFDKNWKDDDQHNYYSYNSMSTKVMLRIHAEQTGANVIGFYIYNKSTIHDNCVSAFTNPASKDADKTAKQLSFKKEGFFIADQGSRYNGYDEMYVVRGSALEIDDDNELDNLQRGSVSVAKVCTAFRKSMSPNLVSKALLTKFIEQIAS